jgi:hypothetical protein
LLCRPQPQVYVEFWPPLPWVAQNITELFNELLVVAYDSIEILILPNPVRAFKPHSMGGERLPRMKDIFQSN